MAYDFFKIFIFKQKSRRVNKINVFFIIKNNNNSYYRTCDMSLMSNVYIVHCDITSQHLPNILNYDST